VDFGCGGSWGSVLAPACARPRHNCPTVNPSSLACPPCSQRPAAAPAERIPEGTASSTPSALPLPASIPRETNPSSSPTRPRKLPWRSWRWRRNRTCFSDGVRCPDLWRPGIRRFPPVRLCGRAPLPHCFSGRRSWCRGNGRPGWSKPVVCLCPIPRPDGASACPPPLTQTIGAAATSSCRWWSGTRRCCCRI